MSIVVSEDLKSKREDGPPGHKVRISLEDSVGPYGDKISKGDRFVPISFGYDNVVNLKVVRVILLSEVD